MTTRAGNIGFLLAGFSNTTTGEPVESGSVEFYEAGTSTQKYVWTEIEKTNGYYSYDLDAVGAAQLYGEGNYKIVVKDSAGSTVATIDDVRIEYPYYGIRTITETTTQLSQDDFILVNTTGGAVTINCLTASSWTRPLKVQRIAGGNSITIDPYGSETIDGDATTAIAYNGVVEIISDGSNLRSAGIRSSTFDADGDTGMQVEETPDEDIIRFDVGGTENVLTIESTAITQHASSTFSGGTVYPTTLKVNEDVAVTATASEINQVCDGYVRGGSSTGDIVTTDDTQTLSGKTFSQGAVLPIINTSSAGGASVLSAMAPNTPNSSALLLSVGKEVSNQNYGYLRFYHTADQSEYNYVELVMDGGGHVRLDGSNVVDIEGAVALSSNPGTIRSTAVDRVVQVFGGTDATNGGCITLTGSSQATPNLILFRTADSERMRVDASGNVGIGKTSGGAPLDVNGEVEATALDINGSADISGTLDVHNQLTIAGELEATALDINGNADISGTLTMHDTLSSTAQVNISNTVIATSLDINGAADISGTLTMSGAPGPIACVDTASYLSLTGGTDITNGAAITMSGSTEGTANTLVVYTANNERMRVDSSGNVGIGKTSGGALLDVNGEVECTSLDVNGTGDISSTLTMGSHVIMSAASPYVKKSDATGQLLLSGGTNTTDGGAIALSGSSQATPNIVFFYTANNERMRIDASGNVGVGKTSGGALLDVNGEVECTSLDVNGAADISGTLTMSGTAAAVNKTDTAGLTYITGGTDSTNGGAITLTGSTQATPNLVLFNTASSERMRIDASGYVGIGKTSGGALLDVNGEVEATALDINGNADISGTLDVHSQLTIAGELEATALDINGNADISGTLDVHDQLTIAGELEATALDINGNADISGTLTLSGTAAAVNKTDTAGLTYVTGGTDGTNGGVITLTGSTQATPNLVLFSTASSERMRIDASGYVGIGKTSGGALLDVNGEVEATALDINGNADISGDLAVDGTANLDNTDIDGTLDVSSTLDIGASTTRRVAPAGTFVTEGDGNPQITDTSFDVGASVTEATWESVGPTGSGADNTWTALDSVPSDADWIEVRAIGTVYQSGGSGSTEYDCYMHFRSGDSSEAAANANMLVRRGVLTNSSGNALDRFTITNKIPVDSSIVFDAYWASDFTTTNELVMYLVGWGFNP